MGKKEEFKESEFLKQAKKDVAKYFKKANDSLDGADKGTCYVVSKLLWDDIVKQSNKIEIAAFEKIASKFTTKTPGEKK